MAARFRFNRAGVLNVWQYDEQVFDFADGRLLLRGANGAGKSKTMEMLLPFVLDGDQSRLTASGRHHTSLLWLLLDGYDGGARTGYLWVEFIRDLPDGGTEAVTCGVGLRATASARQATPWFFITPRRVGVDLDLENDTGPLSQPALTALLGEDEGRSHVFDSGRRYREHIGQHLFGLFPDQYESLLRLIYWLRRPQVGEDIDPKRLAAQLVNALPSVDSDTLAAAGSTFDELQAHGEEIDRQAKSAQALAGFVETYAAYARSVVASRGEAAQSAAKTARRDRRALHTAESDFSQATADLASTDAAKADAVGRVNEATARISALEASPEAKSRASLEELRKRVVTLEGVEKGASTDVAEAETRAQESATAADEAGARLDAAVRELRSATGEAHTDLVEVGVGPDAVPAALALLVIDGWPGPAALEAHAAEIATVASALSEWATRSRSLIGQRLATVTLVGEALKTADSARAVADRAQETAEGHEGRVKSARAAVATASDVSRAAEKAYVASFTEWRTDEVGAGLVLPDLPDLTADVLDELPELVERAIASERDARSAAVVEARLRRQDATSRLDALRSRRTEIESQVDPEPEPPQWVRDPRADRDGAPLWRLVDFRPGLGDAERAGLEAALAASGLLDAWIGPGGLALDPARRDLALLATSTSHEAVADSTLAEWLAPAPAPDVPVTDGAIEAILRSIRTLTADVAAAEAATGAEPQIAVGTDGRWMAGPAHGHTTKESAQFIGASARDAERRRRLAQLDHEIAETEGVKSAAEADLSAATLAADALKAWVRRRPGHSALLGSWARESALAETLTRAEGELEQALAAVRSARAEASTRHTELVRLGEQHDLPVTIDGLRARRERLMSAQGVLDGADRIARGLDATVREWVKDAGRARSDRDELATRRRRHDDAASEAHTERARYDELAATAGAGIAELEERLAEQRSAREVAAAEEQQHSERRDGLLGSVASLTTQVEARRQALAESEPRRAQAYDAFTALHRVAGLIEAARVSDDATSPPTDPADVRRMTDLAATGSQATQNDLLQALALVQSGPASVVEPRVIEVDGAMAAVGRGDTGDEALPVLAARLAAKVEADRALLTERERELFETHVLGQLGDKLREVRRVARELVAAMNDQLQRVTTSQGIRVRLRWKERDDIPADARRALKLLDNPSGALLAEERADLRNALHRLIELSRHETPEDSYTDHLARALDYREWFAFTVQYHRPEVGDWRDLQSRSALSQGEQKVLCYLPLFAAAAAHFTSVAGAAPHAPRFVLLDDAFPKIDARTHPLLFGLLVDLDLDFVVTSERLWGTHSTVPSLAIYEALRNPAQRGIAQFEHRWDGHQLTAVGADA